VGVEADGTAEDPAEGASDAPSLLAVGLIDAALPESDGPGDGAGEQAALKATMAARASPRRKWECTPEC
jgi:hypothetical protein